MQQQQHEVGGAPDIWKLTAVLAAVVLPALLGWLLARPSAAGRDAMHKHRARGRVVVRDTPELMVLDEPTGDGCALRMLVLKSAPGLRQSEVCVRYSSSGKATVQHAPILASHVNRGISLGLGLLPLKLRVRW
jgi:hypothetical protein|eukprot:SAG25_NODE_1591_length_2721_cov_1.887109_3_plen_133_part_00